MKSRKIDRRAALDGSPIGWAHWCPGCRQIHIVNVEQATPAWLEFNIAGGARWSFNGDLERPTFAPSVHITGGGWRRPDGTEVPRLTVCHYFVENGMIRFLDDCAHELRGTTVELPDFPDVRRE